MSKGGKRILESAREALAFTEEMDVRALRHKLGMSQAVFTGHFGVSARTVQDWEQGRQAPSAPIRTFLPVIEREPEAVRRDYPYRKKAQHLPLARRAFPSRGAAGRCCAP